MCSHCTACSTSLNDRMAHLSLDLRTTMAVCNGFGTKSWKRVVKTTMWWPISWYAQCRQYLHISFHCHNHVSTILDESIWEATDPIGTPWNIIKQVNPPKWMTSLDHWKSTFAKPKATKPPANTKERRCMPCMPAVFCWCASSWAYGFSFGRVVQPPMSWPVRS